MGAGAEPPEHPPQLYWICCPIARLAQVAELWPHNTLSHLLLPPHWFWAMEWQLSPEATVYELSDVQEQYCCGQLGLIWLQFVLHQESE